MEPKVGSGYLKTENIEDAKSLISSDFAIINPKIVCGILHLKQAAYLAIKAHEGNYNLAKEKSTEVLLYLTAQRQISKAIDIGGITEQTTEVAWISFDTIPNKITEFLSSDYSVISHEKFDYYILCKPDIPWVFDSLRENPNDRDYIFKFYLKILKKRNYNFKIVSGPHATRTLASLDFIFNN